MGARQPLCVLALSALLASACAGEPPLDEASLELGTGTWRFEPLEDGDEIPLVRGAQGGWHIWISVRADGLASELGSLELVVQPADESRPAQRTTIGVRLDPPDREGRRAYLGWPAILADPACTVGVMYRLEATLTDASGQRVRAERYVTITGGENPPPECSPGGV